jgi:hypothetical protein
MPAVILKCMGAHRKTSAATYSLVKWPRADLMPVSLSCQFSQLLFVCCSQSWPDFRSGQQSQGLGWGLGKEPRLVTEGRDMGGMGTCACVSVVGEGHGGGGFGLYGERRKAKE